MACFGVSLQALACSLHWHSAFERVFRWRAYRLYGRQSRSGMMSWLAAHRHKQLIRANVLAEENISIKWEARNGWQGASTSSRIPKVDLCARVCTSVQVALVRYGWTESCKACAPFSSRADDKSLTDADGLEFRFEGDRCRQAGMRYLECRTEPDRRWHEVHFWSGRQTEDGTKSILGREAQKNTKVVSEGQDPKSGGAVGLDGGKKKEISVQPEAAMAADRPCRCVRT